MINKSRMLVISAFSGVGKGTVIRKLTEKYKDYVLSVSATTREPRAEDKEGVTYFFITEEKFKELIDADEFIEYNCYGTGKSYGSLKSFVREHGDLGRDIVFDIDVHGAMNIKKKYPDAVTVFMLPPSVEEWRRRLIDRATDTPDEIKKRMKQAVSEADFMDRYDYVVVNDDIERCADELHHIMTVEHQKAADHHSELETMKQNVIRIVKENE